MNELSSQLRRMALKNIPARNEPQLIAHTGPAYLISTEGQAIKVEVYYLDDSPTRYKLLQQVYLVWQFELHSSTNCTVNISFPAEQLNNATMALLKNDVESEIKAENWPAEVRWQ